MTDVHEVDVIHRMSDIGAEDWDRCSGGRDPFTRHAHLLALESSGCVSAETGFQPRHLIVRDGAGHVAGVAPAYLKSHSEAEVGADMGWNMAHERFSGPYYPKLQIEVPLCIFPGPRLLVPPGPDRDLLRQRLVRALIAQADHLGVSSAHITFMSAEEQELTTAEGMAVNHGTRFVWENPGYRGFDDYLGQMKCDRRAMIRRERKEANTSGIVWEWHTGSSFPEDQIPEIDALYRRTYEKYNQRPLLRPDYFRRVFRDMPENVLLVLARSGETYAGGSISFVSNDTLSVQHWISDGETKHLHFEATYYQPIEYAIRHGLRFVDAAADGAHKILRGLLPADVNHGHWFRDRKFAELIARGIAKKEKAIADERAVLMRKSPFRHGAKVD